MQSYIHEVGNLPALGCMLHLQLSNTSLLFFSLLAANTDKVPTCSTGTEQN